MQTKSSQRASSVRAPAPAAPSATAKPATSAPAPNDKPAAGSDDGPTSDATPDAGARESDADVGRADGGPDVDAAGPEDAGTTTEDAGQVTELAGDGGTAYLTSNPADAALASLAPDAALHDAAPEEVLPFSETICGATLLEDLHYAEGNEFWLGDQSEILLRVDGFGYLSAQGADDATPPRRYTRNLALSVRPDGTLEDRSGYAVLGYSPNPDDDCLSTLTAPLSLPSRATTLLQLTVNLNSQTELPAEGFDVTKPAASAVAAPFSVPLVDVDGRTHSLTTYIENLGAGSFRYHVLVPQNDVAPGETGFQELGFGDLQFDADGALVTEASPLLCVMYADASGYQCFTFDFGPAIADDGAVSEQGSTSLDSPTTLTKLTTDGYVAGTSTKLAVDAKGVVSVVLDNGQTRVIGSLALARFPNESALGAIDSTAYRQTAASGVPAFDAAGSPGRGTVLR